MLGQVRAMQVNSLQTGLFACDDARQIASMLVTASISNHAACCMLSCPSQRVVRYLRQIRDCSRAKQLLAEAGVQKR